MQGGDVHSSPGAGKEAERRYGPPLRLYERTALPYHNNTLMIALLIF